VSTRVALFATCLGDAFFADATADAVRLLRHLGVDVDYPDGQTCCGQPAYNAGHMDEARRSARHTQAVFADADYVVLPSGSCAGMLRSGYPKLLGAEARDLATRTFELSQFIVHVLGVTHLGSGLAGQRIAYHHGCHALRQLEVEREAVTLLRSAGAEIVGWEAHQECCGFGGLFSVKLPHVSGAMADRKLDTLPGVDVLTSADGGCLLQLAGRAQHRDIGPPTQHLASVLWQAVEIDATVAQSGETAP
jgi:L-lactate dehydrogenase complex protein LldE